jgi:hypothetical protein
MHVYALDAFFSRPPSGAQQDSISDEEAGPMLTWGLFGLVVSCLLPVLYVQYTNSKRVSTGKLLKKQVRHAPARAGAG